MSDLTYEPSHSGLFKWNLTCFTDEGSQRPPKHLPIVNLLASVTEPQSCQTLLTYEPSHSGLFKWNLTCFTDEGSQRPPKHLPIVNLLVSVNEPQSCQT